MAFLEDQFSLSPLRTIRAFQFDDRHHYVCRIFRIPVSHIFPRRGDCKQSLLSEFDNPKWFIGTCKRSRRCSYENQNQEQLSQSSSSGIRNQVGVTRQLGMDIQRPSDWTISIGLSMVFVSKCIRKYGGDLSATACSIQTGSTTTASDQYCNVTRGTAPE